MIILVITFSTSFLFFLTRAATEFWEYENGIYETDFLFKFHCSLFPNEKLSPTGSPTVLFASKIRQEVHSLQKENKTGTPVMEMVNNLDAEVKDYLTCEVKIKDCLPCIFELYQKNKFLPYMTSGVIHKDLVYKPPC